MAKKCKIVKWERERNAFYAPSFDERSLRGRKLRYKVRYRNRCVLCGRPRAYMRRFDLCRICFRTLAAQGEIPGITKSSW